MSAREIALAHHREQRRATRSLLTEARRLWRQVNRQRIRESWAARVPQLVVLMYAAQQLAARSADAYVASVLAAQGISPRAVATLVAGAFAGVASDGRPMPSLLAQPAVTAVTALSRGASATRAMAIGNAHLDMIVSTQAADAGRVAEGVSLTAREEVTGYVRLLVPPSCSRCVILAGRFYGWNDGFQRHPKCDCRHIPANEDTAEDTRTDPRAHFDSLSEADQDRIFTKAGARAIRDGADMSRVVNARRGMETAARAEGRTGGRQIRRSVFGRNLFTTTEAVTKRGVNRQVRLMPESLYEIADTREEALRLLRVHGYIL